MANDADPDERVICFVLVATMAPVTLAAILGGGQIGAGTTLAFVLAVLGISGLIRSFIPSNPSPRVPRARARRSRRRSPWY